MTRHTAQTALRPHVTSSESCALWLGREAGLRATVAPRAGRPSQRLRAQPTGWPRPRDSVPCAREPACQGAERAAQRGQTGPHYTRSRRSGAADRRDRLGSWCQSGGATLSFRVACRDHSRPRGSWKASCPLRSREAREGHLGRSVVRLRKTKVLAPREC